MLGGGGDRLFDDENPLTSWELTRCDTSEPGVLALTYDRKSWIVKVGATVTSEPSRASLLRRERHVLQHVVHG